jgi:hypothetical protein
MSEGHRQRDDLRGTGAKEQSAIRLDGYRLALNRLFQEIDQLGTGRAPVEVKACAGRRVCIHIPEAQDETIAVLGFLAGAEDEGVIISTV